MKLDYLQLVPSGQPFRKRQDHVDYVFERIEQFAGDHPETATILVSQMARHEGRPKLRHLYHSAKLEQGAHTVLLIWAPETKTQMPCRAVDVAKQKDGPTGLRVGALRPFFQQPRRGRDSALPQRDWRSRMMDRPDPFVARYGDRVRFRLGEVGEAVICMEVVRPSRRGT